MAQREVERLKEQLASATMGSSHPAEGTSRVRVPLLHYMTATHAKDFIAYDHLQNVMHCYISAITL